MKLNIKRDSYKPPIVKMPQKIAQQEINLINLNDWPEICWNLAGFTDDFEGTKLIRVLIYFQ